MSLTIYHNPRCSKSRETLALIEAAGQSPHIRLYLENPLIESELKALLRQLDFDDPRLLMRKGEAIYKSLGLKAELDPQKLIKAMISHPKLIERPIVSDGSRAVLGRPPEQVAALL
jgi:arsenate reductase